MNTLLQQRRFTYTGQVKTAAILHPIADQESHQVNGCPMSGQGVGQVEGPIQLRDTVKTTKPMGLKYIFRKKITFF